LSTKRSYSAEEKHNAVEIYLQGKMSRQELAERYGTDRATIRNWFRQYQTFDMERLSRQKQTTRYSPELKLSAVKAYLSGQGSQRELCRRYGIRSDQQLRSCIDNGPMEGSWGILKSEMYYLRKFQSKEQLAQANDEFIEYCNTRRRQHNFDCLPPAEYRKVLERKE